MSFVPRCAFPVPPAATAPVRPRCAASFESGLALLAMRPGADQPVGDDRDERDAEPGHDPTPGIGLGERDPDLLARIAGADSEVIASLLVMVAPPYPPAFTRPGPRRCSVRSGSMFARVVHRCDQAPTPVPAPRTTGSGSGLVHIAPTTVRILWWAVSPAVAGCGVDAVSQPVLRQSLPVRQLPPTSPPAVSRLDCGLAPSIPMSARDGSAGISGPVAGIVLARPQRLTLHPNSELYFLLRCKAVMSFGVPPGFPVRRSDGPQAFSVSVQR